MKPYHAILALVFVCALAGISIQATQPGHQPALVMSPYSPHSVAEITPFDTALVWSIATGNQVVDIIVDNFDSDARDEVAVITQNGTLFLFDDDATLIWKLKLGSTPRTLTSLDGTASVGQEMLIGTNTGILVVGADKTVQMNMSLPEAVYAVAGANLDGDAFDEVVIGCDDFYVYAFEIDTTPLWSYLSNGRVRLIEVADIDADSRDEIVVASDGGRFTLLQDTGAVVFEKTSTTAIRGVAIGDLTTASDPDVVYGNANGTVHVYEATGTLAYSIQIGEGITALEVGDLVTGGRHELALGTSNAALRVFNSSGGLLWNKTLGGQVNAILFSNIGATSDAQILATTNGVITMYNATGWRVLQNNIVDLTRVIDTGDLDTFGGQEFILGTNAGQVAAYGRDYDKDGLADARENLIDGTLWNDPDTDGDRISDGDEVLEYGTDPLSPDSDNDGLSDFAEIFTHNTDPNHKDSDRDGLTDWQEVYLGTDPNDSDTD
ncbi:hypothetical protein EU527_12490, partial [Candidatus Thorarchaeota archaeon]